MRRRAALALIAVLTGGPAWAEDRGPIDVQAYGLRLVLDPAARSVSGHETIRLRMREPGRDLSFTDNALEIVSATAGGRDVAVRREGGRMIFVLPGIAAGEVTLQVAFRGKPRRGLTFEPGLAYTSYFVCDWMVCDQDRPGDKATFDLRVTAPDDGRVVSGVPAGRAYSAYLFGFVAGRFAETRSPTGLRTFSGKPRPGLAPVDDMAAFFAAKAGVPLPKGYWQLVSEAPEAQEGAGFAILGETVLPTAAEPQEDWAIAHELSHQWWGNLLTCETWRDFWLNEGFATFMTAAWKEHRWGRAAYDREMDLARRRLATARAAGFDKPLRWDGSYPSLGTRRAIQYSKGALFLDALRTRLGDGAFWRAIRLYTRRHAGGTVVSGDFQAAVEAVAPGQARDLFHDWVDDKALMTSN